MAPKVDKPSPENFFGFNQVKVRIGKEKSDNKGDRTITTYYDEAGNIIMTKMTSAPKNQDRYFFRNELGQKVTIFDDGRDGKFERVNVTKDDKEYYYKDTDGDGVLDTTNDKDFVDAQFHEFCGFNA